jgi:hypothetical protein
MKSDPLWQLNKLCNLDKHVTVGCSHTVLPIKFAVPHGCPRPPVIPNNEAGETVVLIPLALKGEIEINPQPPVMVFGKPIDAPGADFELSEGDITEIHRFVRREVIPRFGRFFPMGLSIWPPE